MKNLASIFLCLTIVLTACHSPQAPQFTIHYIHLEEYEGDTLYLWRSADKLYTGDRDNERGPLATAVVKDGKATFTGPEDTLNYYQISGIRNEEIRVYPERGEHTIFTIQTDKDFRDFSFESTNPYSKNRELHQLRRDNKYTPGVIRKIAFENIGNAVGIKLLSDIAIIYPDELEWIYNHSNPQLQKRAEVLINIKKQLEETRAINPGDSYINFKQTDYYTNDTIQFSDIAGKGKPTCLFFMPDPNIKNCIRNEIEDIKAQYPDVQIVIATSYFSDPENTDFLEELVNTHKATILDDSRTFENSARWFYRVRSFANYIYLFDIDGKLLSKKPVQYTDYDTFITTWYNMLTAWSKPPLSLSSSSADYLATPEYTVFKEFVVNSPDGIYLMLDFCLHYESAFGLNSYFIDDIVQTKYKDAPRLRDYYQSFSTKKASAPEIVKDYIKRIRKMAHL